MKTYGIDLNVEGLEDDEKKLYTNTYLTKVSNTPSSFEPYIDAEEDFDVMMAQIIKRIGKWVEWTAKRSQSKSMTTKDSLVATTLTFSQSATSSMIRRTTQGPTQLVGGDDQPLDNNVPIT